MAWTEHRIDDWATFLNYASSLRLEQDSMDWYFRGQSSESWGLEPTLTRILRCEEMSRLQAHGIEYGMRRRFEKTYHLNAEALSVVSSTWQDPAWWAIMQHYSCPTRLLDWTLSPFVALYFAVEQAEGLDGCIWIVSSSLLETKSTELGGRLDGAALAAESSRSSVVYPIEARYDTDRSSAQQAAFTVSPDVLGDHAPMIESALKTSDRYARIVISAEKKPEFMARLRAMNVTQRSLFPGMDGLGRDLRDYARTRVWNTRNESELREAPPS